MKRPMLGSSLIAHVDELRRLCGCFPGSTKMCDDCAESVLAVVFDQWQPDSHDHAAESDILTVGTMPDELEEPLPELEAVVVRLLNFGSPQYERTELHMFAPHELTMATRFNVTTPGITQHVTHSTFADRAVSYFKTTPQSDIEHHPEA